MFAVYRYGLSHMTVLLAAWLILRLAGAPAAAYTWAWLPAALVQRVPAVVAASGNDIGNGAAEVLWFYPGWFGGPPGLLLIVCAVVVWLSGRRRAGAPR